MRVSPLSVKEQTLANKPVSSSVLSVSRLGQAEAQHQDERALNARAVSVLKRVKSKLAGTDFPQESGPLDVATQVDRLVMEARSNMNLCQCYIGKCCEPNQSFAPYPLPVMTVMLHVRRLVSILVILRVARPCHG